VRVLLTCSPARPLVATAAELTVIEGEVRAWAEAEEEEEEEEEKEEKMAVAGDAKAVELRRLPETLPVVGESAALAASLSTGEDVRERTRATLLRAVTVWSGVDEGKALGASTLASEICSARSSSRCSSGASGVTLRRDREERRGCGEVTSFLTGSLSEEEEEEGLAGRCPATGGGDGAGALAAEREELEKDVPRADAALLCTSEDCTRVSVWLWACCRERARLRFPEAGIRPSHSLGELLADWLVTGGSTCDCAVSSSKGGLAGEEEVAASAC
jgi:hypothetical protein